MSPTPSPLDASQILDEQFLAVRARVIDVAATLDRIDRADGRVDGDPRMIKLRQSFQELLDNGSGRAERIQLLFSLPYDENQKNNKNGR